MIVARVERDHDQVGRRLLVTPAETGRDERPAVVQTGHGDVQETVVVGDLDPRLPRHRLSVIGIALHETGGDAERASRLRRRDGRRSAGGVATRTARMTLPSFSARFGSLASWTNSVSRTRRVRRRGQLCADCRGVHASEMRAQHELRRDERERMLPLDTRFARKVGRVAV